MASRLTQFVIALGLLSFSAWALYGNWGSIQGHQKPDRRGKLIASPTELDFGNVSEGIHNQVLELVNEDPLREVFIRQVIRTCACNDIVVPPKIEPGQSVFVPIDWNVVGRSGLTSTKLVLVWSKENEPVVRETLQVRLVANVNPDFVVSPETITLYAGTIADVGELTLAPSRITDSRIESASSSHPAIEVLQISNYLVRARIKEGHEKLIYDDSTEIILTTNNTNRPRISVPVFLRPKFQKKPGSS